MDYIKRLYNSSELRKDYSNASKKMITEYGGLQINKLFAIRIPLEKPLVKLIDAITLGKFSKAKEDYYDDELFHLGLLAETDNGNMLIEKIESVHLQPNYVLPDDYQLMEVDGVWDGLTTAILLQNTLQEIGKENFFIYDSVSNNCQKFIIDILNSNGLLTGDLTEFILQDMTDLVENTPSYFPYIARAVTDGKHILDVVQGKGNKKRRTKRKC